MATLDRLAAPPAAPAAPAWSPHKAIAAAVIIAIAIALLQVVQSSGFAQNGQTIQNLTQQQTDLSAQVHELEAEVASLSSLDRTERAARDRLGMVPARNIQYISVGVQAPDSVLLPRPILTSQPAAPTSDTWWQAILRALPIHP